MSLSSASYSVVEGGEVNVTVQLSMVSGVEAVTVKLNTDDGTATGKSVSNMGSDNHYHFVEHLSTTCSSA